ncbi:MAG: tRNA (N(6)-L-threonylcarbamoyladenosine(37)-C(2))-methylthiotransferase MtaB [Clostridia bacterium]|nr:tRNA (N(6)-L-threonylcarbamoyladenosine(37)-C(2))-methylthiotransferase MtaB [Clostridia bacterium]
MKKVKFHTLGCKVNFYETEAMKGLFENAGYIVTEDSNADVFVINTCTVTSVSDKKSRQMIRRAKKENPKAIVAVVGCYSQISPDKVKKIDGVDIVLGTTDRNKIVEYVEKFEGVQISYVKDEIPCVFENLNSIHQSRTRAVLKIQDGCRNFCTYCIIPFARGPLRSKPLGDIVSEVGKLAKDGYSEIVLVGINIAVYGADTDSSLVEVIEKVCAVKGIKRVRLGSIEPNIITDEFVSRIEKYDNFCHQFHLSLQSGSASVLKRMNRHYSPEEYLNVVKKLNKAFCDCAVTTDVMVGFPGETDGEFEESMNTVKKAGFSSIHVFPYSRRKGTTADKMENQVSEDVKTKRAQMMIDLGKELKMNFFKKYLNKTASVLFEREISPGVFEGHTSNFINVIAHGMAKKGEMGDVLLTGFKDDYMTGEIK